jgi:hypothetical protein
MTAFFISFISVQRALLQAKLAPATMGRRELTEQEKNENARRRFANRHCAIAVLDLDFLGGLGLGLPTNPAFDLDFLEDGDRRRAPLARRAR